MKVFLTIFIAVISVSLNAQIAPSRGVAAKPESKYLTAAGLKAGDYWNAAFVYWCFNSYPGGNPLPRTGIGLDMWNRLPAQFRLQASQAKSDPSLIIPGNIFFITENKAYARVGIVVSIDNGVINTVEANTPIYPTRGIYPYKVMQMQRKLGEIDLGFSNFDGSVPNASAK